MTKADDVRLPPGALPEFSKMSLKPGIGKDAMAAVAHSFVASGHSSTQSDVPSSLRHGSRNLPLGRYLVRTLRETLGKDPRSPATLSAEGAYVHRMSTPPPLTKEEMAQKILNLETKQRIYKSRRSL